MRNPPHWFILTINTLAAGLAVALVLSFVLLGCGCTGKSITLYNPATGQRLATYTNTTDSEIGGLEAEFDPATGAFKVKVKSSSQTASESNAAMWAFMQSLSNKIPVVPIP